MNYSGVEKIKLNNYFSSSAANRTVMKINRHQRGHCQLRENYVFWQELAHAKRPTHKKGAHQMRIHTLEKQIFTS